MTSTRVPARDRFWSCNFYSPHPRAILKTFAVYSLVQYGWRRSWSWKRGTLFLGRFRVLSETWPQQKREGKYDRVTVLVLKRDTGVLEYTSWRKLWLDVQQHDSMTYEWCVGEYIHKAIVCYIFHNSMFCRRKRWRMGGREKRRLGTSKKSKSTLENRRALRLAKLLVANVWLGSQGTTSVCVCVCVCVY